MIDLCEHSLLKNELYSFFVYSFDTQTPECPTVIDSIRWSQGSKRADIKVIENNYEIRIAIGTITLSLIIILPRVQCQFDKAFAIVENNSMNPLIRFQGLQGHHPPVEMQIALFFPPWTKYGVSYPSLLHRFFSSKQPSENKIRLFVRPDHKILQPRF